MKKFKRFIKALLFYFHAVGIKNTLSVELPEFLHEAKEDGEDLLDVMEDNMEYYIEYKRIEK